MPWHSADAAPLVLAAALGGLLALPSLAGAVPCMDPTEPDDLNDVAALIEAIRTECECAAYDGISRDFTHGKYVRCARIFAVAAVVNGSLRSQCKGRVIRVFAKSTCGHKASGTKGPKRPCIKKISSSGRIRCTVKPTGACIDTVSLRQRSCPDHQFCIDAADDDGDFDIREFGDDPNCNPLCGDDVAQSPEECDGSDPGSCSIGEGCRADCRCTDCGNGIAESPENCDDADDAACPGQCHLDCTCP